MKRRRKQLQLSQEELARRAEQRRRSLSAEPADDSLRAEILRGAKKIADYAGLGVRQAFYLLEHGTLPATKEGRRWIATKSRLQEHYGIGAPRAESPSRKGDADA